MVVGAAILVVCAIVAVVAGRRAAQMQRGRLGAGPGAPCRNPDRERAARRGAAQRRGGAGRGPRRGRTGRDGVHRPGRRPRSGHRRERQRTGLAAAVAQLRDGRLRDRRRRHGRGHRDRAGRAARHRRHRRRRRARRRRSSPGRRPASRPGRGCPPARMPSSRSRRRRRSTRPVEPGPRGRDATGPLPSACLVHEPVEPGGSVRDAGSDLGGGRHAPEAGTAITAAAVALIAGAGVDRLVVHRRPRVAVLATGDEVRAPGEALGPAGIPDANGPGLRALVTAAGGEAIDLGIASDDLDDVLTRLRAGLDAGADALIVSGGVSVGPYDVVKTAIETIGRIDLWRVAVQPGKPFAFGTARSTGRRRARPPLRPARQSGLVRGHVRALRPSGHPRARGSARPAPTGRSRASSASPSPRATAAARSSASRPSATRPARPIRDGRGRVPVHLAGGQGSHVISALAAADALAVIPEADDSSRPAPRSHSGGSTAHDGRA